MVFKKKVISALTLLFLGFEGVFAASMTETFGEFLKGLSEIISGQYASYFWIVALSGLIGWACWTIGQSVGKAFFKDEKLANALGGLFAGGVIFSRFVEVSFSPLKAAVLTNSQEIVKNFYGLFGFLLVVFGYILLVRTAFKMNKDNRWKKTVISFLIATGAFTVQAVLEKYVGLSNESLGIVDTMLGTVTFIFSIVFFILLIRNALPFLAKKDAHLIAKTKKEREVQINNIERDLINVNTSIRKQKENLAEYIRILGTQTDFSNYLGSLSTLMDNFLALISKIDEIDLRIFDSENRIFINSNETKKHLPEQIKLNQKGIKEIITKISQLINSFNQGDVQENKNKLLVSLRQLDSYLGEELKLEEFSMSEMKEVEKKLEIGIEIGAEEGFNEDYGKLKENIEQEKYADALSLVDNMFVKIIKDSNLDLRVKEIKNLLGILTNAGASEEQINQAKNSLGVHLTNIDSMLK